MPSLNSQHCFVDDDYHLHLLLTRYHSENHNLAPGDFKFGPVFMRLCYELGLEDFAAATLKDTVRPLVQSVQTVNGKKGTEEDVDCAMMLNLITIYFHLD